MKTFLSLMLEYSQLVFAVAVTTAVVWQVMRWANKFYNRIVKTEDEVASIKSDVAIMRTEMATKAELVKLEDKINSTNISLEEKIKNTNASLEEKMNSIETRLGDRITSLKDNDFYHLGKAMLLMASEMMKDNPERFERVKDTILESTPENRRDEIKSITI